MSGIIPTWKSCSFRRHIQRDLFISQDHLTLYGSKLKAAILFLKSLAEICTALWNKSVYRVRVYVCMYIYIYIYVCVYIYIYTDKADIYIYVMTEISLLGNCSFKRLISISYGVDLGHLRYNQFKWLSACHDCSPASLLVGRDWTSPLWGLQTSRASKILVSGSCCRLARWSSCLGKLSSCPKLRWRPLQWSPRNSSGDNPNSCSVRPESRALWLAFHTWTLTPVQTLNFPSVTLTLRE